MSFEQRILAKLDGWNLQTPSYDYTTRLSLHWSQLLGRTPTNESI